MTFKEKEEKVCECFRVETLSSYAPEVKTFIIVDRTTSNCLLEGKNYEEIINEAYNSLL